MIVALLRHGESEANAKDLISSNPDDPYHLTDVGRAQIASLISDNFFKQPVRAVYASPFLRTRESAEILAGGILTDKSTIRIDDRISEMNFGGYSGLSQAAADTEVRETFRRAFAGDCIIRMSPTGESRGQFLTRTYSFLIDVLKTHDEEDRIVLVTHSSVIAVLEKLWIRLKNPSFNRESTKNGQLKLLEFSKSDIANLEVELKKVHDSMAALTAEFRCTSQGVRYAFTPAVARYLGGELPTGLVLYAERKDLVAKTVSALNNKSFWFAGYLVSNARTSKNNSVQAVFATKKIRAGNETVATTALGQPIRRYCKQYYLDEA